MKDNVTVSVCMITYNHAKYIKMAIEGILMQQTDFLIELVIGEDCSTDETRDICLEYQNKYPEIIKLNLPESNLGIKNNLLKTIELSKGKYIAFCEGDDYWTDPLKLQKQVDFLESHSEYVCCSHDYKFYYQDVDRFEDSENNGYANFAYDKDYSLKHWCTQPLTVVVRRDAIKLEDLFKYKIVVDHILIYEILKSGNGYFLSDCMGVYRKHSGGIWSGIAGTYKEIQYHYDVFSELYKYNKSDNVVETIYKTKIYALFLINLSKDVQTRFYDKKHLKEYISVEKSVINKMKTMLRSFVLYFKYIVLKKSLML
ncbi:glycosyltransferase [Coprobacter sp.]